MESVIIFFACLNLTTISTTRPLGDQAISCERFQMAHCLFFLRRGWLKAVSAILATEILTHHLFLSYMVSLSPRTRVISDPLYYTNGYYFRLADEADCFPALCMNKCGLRRRFHTPSHSNSRHPLPHEFLSRFGRPLESVRPLLETLDLSLVAAAVGKVRYSFGSTSSPSLLSTYHRRFSVLLELQPMIYAISYCTQYWSFVSSVRF